MQFLSFYFTFLLAKFKIKYDHRTYHLQQSSIQNCTQHYDSYIFKYLQNSNKMNYSAQYLALGLKELNAELTCQLKANDEGADSFKYILFEVV